MSRRTYFLIVPLLLMLIDVPLSENPANLLYGQKAGKQNVLEMPNTPLQLTTISVVPSFINVRASSYFTIDVAIADVLDLYGWEFTLWWNRTILEATTVNEGSFLKTGGNTFFYQSINNTEGYILVDCTLLGDVPGVNGGGTLATIAFHTRNIGETALDLCETILVSSTETQIQHQTIDGYIKSLRPSSGSTSGGSPQSRPPLLR